MIKQLYTILLLPALVSIVCCRQNASLQDTIHPENLRCELLTNPLGIDSPVPHLSWMSTSQQINERQTAYHILVASSKENLEADNGNIWDSKIIKSDKSIHIPYEGDELTTGMECYWKVKVWDKEGNESEWSETGYWSMGIMNDKDWKAKWIGLEKPVGNDDPDAEHTKLSSRYLRKEFKAENKIRKATVYICGLGLYELYLNGKRIGNQVLSPGQTQFNKRCLYVTYDVTDMLSAGNNAIGVILGNGRFFPMRHNEPTIMEGFGYPRLLFQLDIQYFDGSTGQIVSDDSWKLTTDGPITENNEYDGEKYDARKEMPGWNQSGFNDSNWRKVEIVDNPSEKLSAQMNEPIRITQTIQPIGLKEVKPDVFIFDMGQNMVGWIELKVEGEAGSQVKMRFSEALQKDGSLYLDNIRSADVTDIYTCKGKGTEIWEPRFTYHGFRFVEMTGFPGIPDLNTITGKVVHDDVKPAGTFECSVNMVNKIFQNGVWGIRGNYRSFPTDCPQRDERMAWLGDRATGSRGESYIFDISKLYAKWIRDIGDAQLESGSISDVSPAYWKLYNDNITWDGTPIMLANMLYEQYGDEKVIQQSYSYLKKWYDYMVNSYYDKGIMPRDSYGDWCVPPEEPEVIHSKDPKRLTSGEFIGTAFFIHMSDVMKKFALILDKDNDAKYFADLESSMIKAFNEQFLDTDSGTYGNNSATSNVIVLAFNLVPDTLRDKMVSNLIQKIEEQHKGHMPVGLVGAEFIMRTLTEVGYPDVALRFATQTDYPSWGYMAEQGATTIWELWNGNTADPAMNSRNHVMLLGDFNIWLFENLAGIKPIKPAFKEIEMKPVLVEGLDFVEATHNCPYGIIKSSWNKTNHKFNWHIHIPANTNAKVHIPADKENDVKINGIKLSKCVDVEISEISNGYVVINCGSGEYKISSVNFSTLVR
jgi:alpha-L-rhamnosidase